MHLVFEILILKIEALFEDGQVNKLKVHRLSFSGGHELNFVRSVNVFFSDNAGIFDGEGES